MSRSDQQRIADLLESVSRCRRFIANLEDEVPDIAATAEDAIKRNL